MKKKILMSFTLVPFPLRAHGLSVRYLPIIQYLYRFHDIDLIVINGDGTEQCHVDGLREYCRKISVLPDPRCDHHDAFSKGITYTKFLLPWTPPFSVVVHGGAMVTRGIVEAAKGVHYDALVWVGGDLLPNMMDALPSLSVEKVFVDFIDSPFLWANRRKENLFGLRLLDRYDRWKTRRWEGEIIRKVDGTIYISRIDADAIPSGHVPMGKRYVIPNGINVPSGTNTERVSLPSPNIGFLGNMGYPPNMEAVEWLYKEVFAPLRKIRSDLTLVVIGRYPSPSILRLGEMPGVLVTGAIDDIWEYIRAIDVFLFPLFRGAGLKNKILEAMYAGRPVVTTEIGNEGIDAIPGKEVVLGRTPEDFQREALRLLDSDEERVRMGISAHAFVVGKFSWDRILFAFENLILGHDPEIGTESRPCGIR